MAQCLRPLINGDAPGHRAGDLGVVVVDGGGADHEVAVTQIFRAVPDVHMDAQRPQTLDRIALADVRPADGQAHPTQDLGQRAHGHAADPHQMDALSGEHIRFNGLRILHHNDHYSLKTLPEPCKSARVCGMMVRQRDGSV